MRQRQKSLILKMIKSIKSNRASPRSPLVRPAQGHTYGDRALVKQGDIQRYHTRPPTSPCAWVVEDNFGIQWELPFFIADYIPPVLEELDQQLEMERVQAQLDYDHGSMHREGSTEGGVQGGGQMAAAPENHQIIELLEEEERLDLPE
ncbi:uncharacterized protein LOC126470666 [Schistocerca serialis cubense]|uniref:uncharacterized protein LOC126470666 n=1 Tax=Schistocerca serialis cubense TaxID=2023355 RepID=UPI00214ED688|nr:uncharacterized protein LOC126470666 [Schistocerca serialis cubense]